MIKTPVQRVQCLAASVQRLVFIFLLFTIYYLLFTISSASAQTVSSSTNPDVPHNLHLFTQNVMIETMSALTCQLTGIDPVNPNQKCLGIDQETGKIGFVEGGGGAIGLMGNLIAITYTPPLHTGDYFRYLADNFGLAKPAYAQGVGFQGLSPLINLWAAFRNIVYLFFVLVFVIIGLAIMLRVKIDPRTVMTIENQIPKIIIGLLLVTFSFAIAGFLIDMMYVVIYLIFGAISGVPGVNVSSLNPAGMQGKNAIEAAGGLGGLAGIAKDVSGAVGNVISSIFTGTGGTALGAILGGIIGAATGAAAGSLIPGIGNLIGGIIGGIVGVAGGGITGSNLLGLIGSIIAFLIIAIALLWALFRLWFQLIMAYIYILLDVVFAPFWILGGLLPGSPVGFGGWLRDILANLSAFPTTIVLFLLGKVFMDAFSQSSQTSQPLFVPPLIGNPSGGNASPLGAIIGLGVILLAPQVVNMMKDAFKPPPFKYGAAIGQAIGVGPGVLGGAWTAVASPYGTLAHFERLKEKWTKKEGIIGAVAKRVAGGPKSQGTSS